MLILEENLGNDDDSVFGCRDDGDVIVGSDLKSRGIDSLAEFDSGGVHRQGK